MGLITMAKTALAAALLALLLFVNAETGAALEHPETELELSSITTKLGTQVDLDIPLRDESGAATSLRQVARDGRPFILLPAYYHCPRLCGLVMNTIKDVLPKLGLKLNSDFRIITVSFDVSDTPESATNRATEMRQGLLPAEDAALGWRFLIGEQKNVKTLMNQIGFHYLKDNGEFAHAAALMILTPEGQISQYFTGISFAPQDVKLALVEAGRGSIGTAIDHFLLFCFRFDQTKGRYTWAAFNLVRAGAATTIVFLAGLILLLRRRERLSSLNK